MIEINTKSNRPRIIQITPIKSHKNYSRELRDVDRESPCGKISGLFALLPNPLLIPLICGQTLD